MNRWIIACLPFAVALVIVGAIKGLEAWAKWREREAMRVRDTRLHRYGMASFKGTKDRFLS